MNEHKTFEELERLAYMSNLPKIAKLYAQLDDNEGDEYEIERLKSKIDDLEFQCNEQNITLEKIADIINE
jgi:hypothetical protein